MIAIVATVVTLATVEIATAAIVTVAVVTVVASVAMVAVMAVTAQAQRVPWAAAAASADPDCRRLEPLNRRDPGSAGAALSLEDKLALSPIVVQGRLISRCSLSGGRALQCSRAFSFTDSRLSRPAN